MVYDATHYLASFSEDGDTTLPGAGQVQDEDVVEYANGTWSVWFDGTAAGLTDSSQDIDAFSLPTAPGGNPPPPPPPPAGSGNGNGPLLYSTLVNLNPTGVSGTADNADLYSWNGTTTTRSMDVTAAPYQLPASANVDGFDRVDANHFYLSFAGNTAVPGLGTVQDEDIVYWDNGTWSVWFNATARGMTSAALDLDAISISGNTVYFSTTGNANPPGVSGSADDADIYSWNGSKFARVWDASAADIPSAANVDGYVRTDATHFYLSFAPNTTVPGLGVVQDEDVVLFENGVWSVYFDGTAHGLDTLLQDVDAFDLP